jgi:fructose-1,6-bisphosphatase I
MLVLTLGDGVKGFTLDREMGSFVLTHEEHPIPESTQNSPSTCPTSATGKPRCKRYVGELLAGEKAR